MKKFLLSAVTIALLSGSAFASTSGDLVAWLSPLFGNHSLVGDKGCDAISISLFGNPSPQEIVDVDIRVGDHSGYVASNDSKIEFSVESLKYEKTDYPDMWCGDRVRRRVVITKNPEGALASLIMKQDSATGCIYFWHRDFSLECRAKSTQSE